MNREIKFRAWDGEKMIPFGLFDTDEGYHFSEYKNIYSYPIMQFTGLKDKNNNEIYEGDIVKAHDHPTGIENATGEVYFKDGAFMLTNSIVPLGNYGTAWTETIGNIYQHPELLK